MYLGGTCKYEKQRRYGATGSGESVLVELWLSCVPVELRSRSSAGTCSTSDLQIAISGVLFLEYASTSQGASLHGLVECAHSQIQLSIRVS